jgi:hypothetical protein
VRGGEGQSCQWTGHRIEDLGGSGAVGWSGAFLGSSPISHESRNICACVRGDSFFTCCSCTPHGRSMYILSCGSGSSELSLWIRECTSDPNPFEWRTFSLNSLGAL